METFQTMVGHGIPNLVSRFSPEQARTPEQLARTLAEFSAYYGAHSADHTRPYPGIVPLLAHLHDAWESGWQSTPTRRMTSAVR